MQVCAQRARLTGADGRPAPPGARRWRRACAWRRRRRARGAPAVWPACRWASRMRWRASACTASCRPRPLRRARPVLPARPRPAPPTPWPKLVPRNADRGPAARASGGSQRRGPRQVWRGTRQGPRRGTRSGRWRRMRCWRCRTRVCAPGRPVRPAQQRERACCAASMCRRPSGRHASRACIQITGQAWP